MHTTLSINQLNKVAKENYKILLKYCDILKQEGYWTEAEQVVKKPIEQVLDWYLQSCMITTALRCSNLFYQSQIELFIQLTNSNPFDISIEEGLTDDIIILAQKAQESTPILLQLVSLRDSKKNTTMAGLFFDAILNILLVTAIFSAVNASVIIHCLHVYCEKAAIFINNSSRNKVFVDEKYLFRKVCVQDLEESTHILIKSGEDFNQYKKDSLYYPSIPVIQKNNLAQESSTTTVSIDTNTLDDLLAQLNNLVGLANVKQEINSLINLIKVKQLRDKYGLPQMDMSYHMVFTGNPGTGKTTVARLIAKIYKELKILSKGDLIETDRAGLVAGYVGQTALKVQEVVSRAIGGVLFIDEAYSLCNTDATNDFGTEVIDTLVKMMEDHRDDLVVIVAGYTKEMKKFLESNTGLVSRFNKFIEFHDYTADELLLILNKMAKDNGYHLDFGAQTRVKRYLLEMGEKEWNSFGNARGIRNFFERLVSVFANRVVTYEAPSKEQLTMIEEIDVERTI